MIARRPKFALQMVALVGVVGLALFGAYKLLEDPQNQFFGQSVTSGPPNERVVALTYDDGPNPPYTDRILDELRAHHAKATFFVVGRAVKAYPRTAARIVREGNAIGNHTWDHAHLVVQTKKQIHDELARTESAIAVATGVHTHLMRPPFGARDFAVFDQVRKDGYQVVMWSVPLPKDWEQPGDATIAKRVLSHVKDGSIIVLHDGNRGMVCTKKPKPCDRSQDVGATRIIISTLQQQGYRFVTIPELMALRAARQDQLTRTTAHSI